MYQRDYEMLLNIILGALVEEINANFVKPYDLKTIDPDFMGLIVNTFTQPRISPFYQDNYLYAGLTYFFDPYTPKATTFEREISERNVYEAHTETLYRVIDHVQSKVKDNMKK